MDAKFRILSVALALNSTPLYSQERNLPEEIRALSAVCSTGVSLEFKGQIEGGLNKFLGKIIEGTGELKLDQGEANFISEFEDENLKLEARKIFAGCVIDSMRIIYNMKEELRSEKTPSRVLVPDAPQVVRSGQEFALRIEESATLENGAIVAVQRARFEGLVPGILLTNAGTSRYDQLKIGESARVPNAENCIVSFYSRRAGDTKGAYVYSFRYQCTE